MIHDLAYFDKPIQIFQIIIWHRTINDKQLSMYAMRLMLDYLISTDNKSHFRGRELWEQCFADRIKFDGVKVVG